MESVQTIKDENRRVKTSSIVCKERHVGLVSAVDSKASTTEEPREGELHSGGVRVRRMTGASTAIAI